MPLFVDVVVVIRLDEMDQKGDFSTGGSGESQPGFHFPFIESLPREKLNEAGWGVWDRGCDGRVGTGDEEAPSLLGHLGIWTLHRGRPEGSILQVLLILKHCGFLCLYID